MKKIVSIVLLATIGLGLIVGCSKSEEATTNPTGKVEGAQVDRTKTQADAATAKE